MSEPKPSRTTLAAEVAAEAERKADAGKDWHYPEGKTLDEIIAEHGRRQLAWLRVWEALDELARDADIAAVSEVADTLRIWQSLASSGQFADDAQGVHEPIDGLLPKGRHGAKFPPGRKAGAVGKVRQWARAYLKRHQRASAAEAWDALKARPPQGVEVFGEPTRNARNHIRTDGEPDTGFGQFSNIVSEERPKRG